MFENRSDSYPPPIDLKEYGGRGVGGDIPAPSLQPGQNEIVVNVTLVYKVK